MADINSYVAAGICGFLDQPRNVPWLPDPGVNDLFDWHQKSADRNGLDGHPYHAGRRISPAGTRCPRQNGRSGTGDAGNCFMISSPSYRMLEPVKTASGVHPWRLACAVSAIGVAAAGCTNAPAGTVQAGGTRPGTTPAASHAPASPSPRATTAPPVPPAPHVVVSRLRTADGALVTVAAFRGPVQYVLHNGSGDPGAAAAGLVRAGPAVTGAERQRLLAAFNGGFKLSAGAGGYEQEGHVIATLRTGLASLVIDRSGQARIGIWGGQRARAGRGGLQRPAKPAAPRLPGPADRRGGQPGPVGCHPGRRRVRRRQRRRAGLLG